MGTEPSPSIVDVEALACRSGERYLFRDVSFQVRQGEVLGILGRVGVGKTRLLRILRGLETAESGTVRFAPNIRRDEIGYVFQNDLLVPWLTVRENLALCARTGDVEKVAGEFGLTRWLDLRPTQLSGGLRQKANLARGFLNHPGVVLLDEPFSALDPVEKTELMRLFAAKKTTAIFVTHDVREALFLCDRIAFLSAREGKLLHFYQNPHRGILNTRELFHPSDTSSLYWELHGCYENEDSSLIRD